MHHQEFRSRSFNIRIVGLAEHRDENTLELASHFLREKQLLTPEQNVHECIETAHRVGKRSPENKKTRPIVMRFFRRPDVFRILTDVKQKSVNKNSDIKIVKDRTKRELETRKLAYNQLKAAWENGIPATVNKNLLLVIYGRITRIERKWHPQFVICCFCFYVEWSASWRGPHSTPVALFPLPSFEILVWDTAELHLMKETETWSFSAATFISTSRGGGWCLLFYLLLIYCFTLERSKSKIRSTHLMITAWCLH